MANPFLTQIELPTGGVYDLHDSRVDSINSFDYTVSTDAATTPAGVKWGDPEVTGTLAASADTMYKIYLVPSTNGTNDIYDEYITVNNGGTYSWEMFGNTKLPDMDDYVKNADGHSGDTAGELAYASTVSGTVDIPATFATSVASTASQTINVSGTPNGELDVTTTTVSISPTTGSVTYTPEGSNAASSVSGSCDVTPEGSITVGSGAANYTPAGSVAAPEITVSSAGSTASVNGVSDVGSMPTYTVSGTKLTIGAGAVPSTVSATFKTGDATYSASTCAFTGTGVDLEFSGLTSTGTISGTAAAQTFSGTGVRLATDNAVATTATFTGGATTFSGSIDLPDTYSTTVASTASQALDITVS